MKPLFSKSPQCPALFFSLSLAIFFLAFACPPQTLMGQYVIYENDFDQYPTNRVYTDADLDKDWNNPSFNNGVTEGRVSIVTGPEAYGGTGSALAVSYPAGEHGPSETGAQWKFELDANLEEVVLSYRVKFKTGFDFVRGGKLPGLAGGTAPTGSTSANGVNGWTGRMMWRTDFTGVSGQPEQTTANGISYAKYTDSGPAQDGEDEDKNYWNNPDSSIVTLQSGVWYKITQRVKMNQPGVSDGILQIWLDDVLVLDEQDKLFRLTSELSIDQMYFSTFFGGGSSWQTSKDETVYFDDFEFVRPSTNLLRVPQDYSTVQSAIDAALPGDIVNVLGRRTENVVIDKPLLVRGNAGTWLTAADRTQPCITIDSDNVRVNSIQARFGSEGVLVLAGSRNADVDTMTVRYADAGVVAQEDCHGCTVTNCYLFRLKGDAVNISSSNGFVVSDNTAVFNDGIGFVFDDSNNGAAINNLAYTGDSDGFQFVGNDNIVLDNRSMFNLGRGFLFLGDENTVTTNIAWRSGGDGFDFETSSDNLVQLNNSRYNSGNGYVFQNLSNNNTIVDNYTRTNDVNGYLIDLSESNVFDSNEADDNGLHGFWLTNTSLQNHLKKNHSEDNVGAGYFDEGVDNTFFQNSLRRNGQ
ncbi:MAG: nitrous oxide reductase family maturation protein NosD [Mariniblastus sp.]